MKKLFKFKITPIVFIRHEATKNHRRPYTMANLTEVKAITYNIIIEDPYFKTISFQELEVVTNWMDGKGYSILEKLSRNTQMATTKGKINVYLATILGIKIPKKQI